MEKNFDKVQEELEKYHVSFNVVTFDESTRTSSDAAKAIGCELAQIAKTIVFSTESGNAVCVIASGPNRVDEKLLENIVCEKVKKASPEFVIENTGFEIGGVSPLSQKRNILIFIDEDLMKFEFVWTAAGTAHSVFEISPKDLINITGAKVVRIKV